MSNRFIARLPLWVAATERGGVAVAFNDNFDRADDPTGLGANWTQRNGVIGILGNRADLVTFASPRSAATTSKYASANGRIKVNLAVAPSTGGMQAGVVVRYVDLDNYLFAWVDSVNRKLMERAAGVETQLISNVGSGPYDGQDQEVEADGTALELFMNLVSMGTSTSSVGLGATNHGMHIFGDPSDPVRLDNFSAGPL